MRKISLILLIIFLSNTSIEAQKATFLRVYNLKNKKIVSGFFSGTTDSSIVIVRGNERVETLILNVGTIQTKRSNARSSFLGAVIGGVTLATFGAISGEKPQEGSMALSSKGAGVAIGLIIGIPIGGLIGSIIPSFVKKQTFSIDGSTTNWATQRPLIDKLARYTFR